MNVYVSVGVDSYTMCVKALKKIQYVELTFTSSEMFHFRQHVMLQRADYECEVREQPVHKSDNVVTFEQ